MFGKWTKDAIEFAGISQAELARRLTAEFNISVDRAAINKATLGKRDISADELVAISSITKFPIPEVEDAPHAEVNIVGKVLAGSDMVMFSHGDGPIGTIRAPEWARDVTVAVEVKGSSLGELLDGSYLFYNDVRNLPDQNWIGTICICGLADGRVVVKSLRKGRLPNRWDLHANIGPPIYDAELEWAAQIKEIRPKG